MVDNGNGGGDDGDGHDAAFVVGKGMKGMITMPWRGGGGEECK